VKSNWPFETQNGTPFFLLCLSLCRFFQLGEHLVSVERTGLTISNDWQNVQGVDACFWVN